MVGRPAGTAGGTGAYATSRPRRACRSGRTAAVRSAAAMMSALKKPVGLRTRATTRAVAPPVSAT